MFLVHYRNRARRAEEAQRDSEKARKATLDHYRTALLRLDAANQREAALQAALAAAREERDDALARYDDVMATLMWLERDFKVTGSEA